MKKETKHSLSLLLLVIISLKKVYLLIEFPISAELRFEIQDETHKNPFLTLNRSRDTLTPLNRPKFFFKFPETHIAA